MKIQLIDMRKKGDYGHDRNLAGMEAYIILKVRKRR